MRLRQRIGQMLGGNRLWGRGLRSRNSVKHRVAPLCALCATALKLMRFTDLRPITELGCAFAGHWASILVPLALSWTSPLAWSVKGLPLSRPRGHGTVNRAVRAETFAVMFVSRPFQI